MQSYDRRRSTDSANHVEEGETQIDGEGKPNSAGSGELKLLPKDTNVMKSCGVAGLFLALLIFSCQVSNLLTNELLCTILVVILALDYLIDCNVRPGCKQRHQYWNWSLGRTVLRCSRIGNILRWMEALFSKVQVCSILN